MPYRLLAEIYLSVAPFTHDARLYAFTVVEVRGLIKLVVASRAIVAKVQSVAMGTPECSTVFGSHYHHDFPSFGSIPPPPRCRRTCWIKQRDLLLTKVSGDTVVRKLQ